MKRSILIFLLLPALSGAGKVKLPALLSDNAVLQQQTDVKLWGAATGEMFIMGFILPFIILAEIIGGFVMFKSYLSYHYIAKYPRQYRLYYKIPDSIWYFSKEEAEKRNDPVYPPRKKSVEEE